MCVPYPLIRTFTRKWGKRLVQRGIGSDVSKSPCVTYTRGMWVFVSLIVTEPHNSHESALNCWSYFSSSTDSISCFQLCRTWAQTTLSAQAGSITERSQEAPH
ncbi:hypothetical protein KIL84_003318 [Mauremys mutica]|uniref:Uncharacterized protein n=1 Tax=Mauremys mutica TaxID=74926 RepID=A0A9D4ATE1_9SAUR|nr:hypothetical protein KIL84_003318 [Mauremys mutica]